MSKYVRVLFEEGVEAEKISGELSNEQMADALREEYAASVNKTDPTDIGHYDSYSQIEEAEENGSISGKTAEQLRLKARRQRGFRR